jgi:AcrR family transcriptional regulator
MVASDVTDGRTGGSARAAASRVRIIEAGARCLARWGIAKTTMDDVAREAGVSRATVYRAYVGKDELVIAVGLYEEGRFFASLGPELERATTLEDTLVAAVWRGSRWLHDNQVLTYLLEHEPEALLPHIAFDRIGPLLYRTHAVLDPHLTRFVDPATSRQLSEWATRVVLSYWLKPSARLDLTEEAQTRHLVARYLLPGLAGLPTEPIVTIAPTAPTAPTAR